MRQNQTLTQLLRGKAIATVKASAGSVHIHFQNGLDMAINGRMSDGVPSGLPAGMVEIVRDDEREMQIELDSGAVLHVVVSDPGGSVIVRDANNTVKYAG